MALNAAQFGVPNDPVSADIHRVSQQYNRQNGMPPIKGDVSGIVMPSAGSRMMGQQLHDQPDFDPSESTAASYKALEEETGRQFDLMTRSRSKGGLGLSADVSPVDPYGRRDTSQPFADQPNQIMGDLKNDIGNGHVAGLASRTTGSVVPGFSHPDTNDMFRVVHDTFGHAGGNRGIDRHGEEAAYQLHRQMYSQAARPALAAQLRNQTGYLVTYGQFPSGLKHTVGYDSGPLQPNQFGEDYHTLRQSADQYSKDQGLL